MENYNLESLVRQTLTSTLQEDVNLILFYRFFYSSFILMLFSHYHKK